ncbi:MAG: SDR family NAD(P)-dependent oxidoreductase [Myxococcota bacterium]
MPTPRNLPPRPRAVVTGAGRGLGRALALELARRGGRVVVSDVAREGAEESARLVREAGGEAHVVLCDVRDRSAVFALAAAAEARLGGVDVVCNNAGVAVAGPFEDVSDEDWRWVVDVNLMGVVHGCQAFAPGMLARGGGFILNVASAAGIVSTPRMAPYNTTKAAVVALSETLHAEFHDRNVGVSVLCPTFFETGIMEASRGPLSARERGRAEKAMRLSKVQAPDVARAALEGLEAGSLYVLPMRDARLFWRLKRTQPQAFADLLKGGIERFTKPLLRVRQSLR